MPLGPLERTVDQALFESYAQGRAHAGAQLGGKFAQWSAVNDAVTCDFCGWADLRIFPIAQVPWDPPTHWGCRCIIAYILDSEFTPTPDWGDGPPPSAFPPGTSNGMKGGQPTLANEGKAAASELNPYRLKAQELADEWEISVRDTLSWESGSDVTNAFKSHEFKTRAKAWHEDAVKQMMGAEYDSVAQGHLGYILDEWSMATTDELRAVIEALTRGSADDLSAAITALLDETPHLGSGLIGSTARTEAMIQHWEAHRTLVGELTKRTPMVDKDGFVTVYRGVKGSSDPVFSSKNFIDDTYEALVAGDGEFAIGEKFVSSWSTSEEVAAEFATGISERGIVFAKKVPAEDVLVGWFEHPSLAIYGKERELLWANWDGTLVPKSWGTYTDLGSSIPDAPGFRIRSSVMRVEVH